MATLRANIGGVWVPIGGEQDEVFVGPDDPGANYELWYDTDDPGIALPTLAQIEQANYTPGISGIVLGTGGTPTNAAAYMFIGGPKSGDYGLLWVTGQLTLGSSGFSVTGPVMDLPAGFKNTMSWSNAPVPGGVTYWNTVEGGDWEGYLRVHDGDSLGFCMRGSAGAYTNVAYVSATTPFTWGAGDTIYYNALLRAQRV